MYTYRRLKTLRRTSPVGGYNYDSTAIRLPFDSHLTATRDRATTVGRRRYDRKPPCVWAAALRPKYVNRSA